MKAVSYWLVFFCFMSGLSGCVSYQEDSFGNRIVKEDRSNETVSIHINLARQYLSEKDVMNAQRTLRKAERHSPNNAELSEIYALYALSYGIQGENELTRRYFKRSLSIEPNNSDTLNNYGAWLHSLGEYEAARDVFIKTSKDEAYDERGRVFENLGITYLRLEDIPKAHKSFKRAVNIDSRLPRAWFYLARLNVDDGKFLAANEYYREYASLVLNKSARGLWLGIEIGMELKDYNLVASYGLQLRNTYPDSEEWQKYKELRREYPELY